MARNKTYTEQELKTAVESSKSLNEVVTRLGIRQGAAYYGVKSRIETAKLDTSHFEGRHWRKGKTALDDPRLRSGGTKSVFTSQSDASAAYVRLLVLKHNLLPYSCAICTNKGTWFGGVLALQLDHINGCRTDQQIENLRFLCPNCHSQTPTFTGRNRTLKNEPRMKVSEEELVKALKDSANVLQALRKVGLANGRNYERAYRLMRTYNIIFEPAPCSSEQSQTRVARVPTCCDCGTKISLVSTRCVSCDYRQRRCRASTLPIQYKIEWPEQALLAEMIKSTPVSTLSKQLGVSDKAVAKHCKKLGIAVPARGYWAKKRAGKIS